MSINNNFPINKSQRQLRVGELLRKELSEALVKNDFHHSDLINFSMNLMKTVSYQCFLLFYFNYFSTIETRTKIKFKK